jgi:hypothetical protein
VPQIRTILCLVALFSIGSITPSHAQQIPRAQVQGVVSDAISGAGLEAVHVFVSRSTFGATSSPNGDYRITLPIGAHRIVVSRLGYKTQIHDVMIHASKAYLLNFQLEEEVISLGELTVSGLRDRDRNAYLRRFYDAFLGKTANADQVLVENPEVLNFLREEDRLTVTASEPLRLVNRALGYRIEHHLHHFMIKGDETWQDGESSFTAMTPSSEEESRQWDVNRRKAYYGSSQHFFQSVVRNSSREEGFQVYLVSDPTVVGQPRGSEALFAAPLPKPQFAINPFALLSEGETGNEFVLDLSTFALIVFTREEEDPHYAEWQKVYHTGQPRDLQYSWIKLRNEPATLDLQGNILDPYAFFFFGYMAFEREADLLPKEYRPG